MKIRKAYSFDDVLLVPKFSDISSRRNVETSVNLGRGIKLDIPILSANMVSVTDATMARAIVASGAMAVLHRFEKEDSYSSCEERIQTWMNATDLILDPTTGSVLVGRDSIYKTGRVALSFGVTKEEKQFFDHFVSMFKKHMKIICVDVAHGHHENISNMIKYIRSVLPNVLIIAGNVATADGACFLAEAGADVIKVGIGCGAACSTRTATGNGVPQLTALEDVRTGLDYKGFYETKIIADGGIRAGGDVVKACCFADAVMIGGLFAGAIEAPGRNFYINGKAYKEYAGSSTHKTSYVEGVVGLVPRTSSIKEIISKLMDGIRSGMSYQGVHHLNELKSYPEFVEISNAGLIESKPHDILL